MMNMDPTRLPSYLRGASETELATLAQQARSPQIITAVQAEMDRRGGGAGGLTPQEKQTPAPALADIATEGWVPPWQRPNGGLNMALQSAGPVAAGDMPNPGRPPVMEKLPPAQNVGWAPGMDPAKDDDDIPPETLATARALEDAGDDPDAMAALLQEIQGGIQSPDDMRSNAIARAGFAMAASRNPYFFGALGEGAGAGLDAYEKSKQEALMNRVRTASMQSEERDYQDKKEVRDEYKAEVATLSPDDQKLIRLIGPDNYAAIVAAGMKPQNVDEQIQRYSYAKSQGYDKSFADWILDQKKATGSSSTVNVNMPKSIGKGDEKMAELGAEGYMQAQSVLPLFGVAREAAKNFPQSGPLGSAALLVERGKSYLGLPNNAQQGEVLQSMQTRLGVLQRMPGSGATSNMEMGLYMSAVPGLLNTQQGNLALADIGEKLTKRSMQNFQNWQQYVNEHGNSVGYQPNDEPLLSPEETNLLKGAAASSGGDTETKDATGVVPNGTVVQELPEGFE